MAANMVPAISSTALPATPADEWADGMNEFIGTHVTRTPVGTPGPAVPGAFPTHLESDSDSSMPKITAANAQEQASALLASAQSYLPSLEQAKAYLPHGVAAYLPSSPTQSPPTASAPVDVGHATTVPYTASAPEPYRQDTNSSSTVDVGHGATVPYTESAPEPYRQDTNSSSTVNVGHSATVPYTESAPEPYSQSQSAAQSHTSFATSTHSGPGLAGVGAGAGFSPSSPTHSTTAHTGHPASATGVPPPTPTPASGLLPSHPGVGGGGDAPTPSPALGPPGPPSPAQVVQSPAPLEPSASTELALAAEKSGSSSSGADVVGSPLPGAVGVNAGGPPSYSSSSSSVGGRPRPTSGLLPSHPGVASTSTSTAGRPTPNPDLLPSHPAAGPQPHVHAYPAHTYDSASASSSTSTTPAVHAYATQALDAAGARHPTPHAVPLPPLPSSSIDSGYAASSESGLVSPPASSANNNNGATFPPFVGDLGLPTTSSTGAHGVQGSAALNSSRLADVVPTGTDSRSRTREGGVPTGDFDRSPHHERSSAAQPAHGENAHGGSGMVPTGDPPSTEYNTSSSTPDADSSGGSAEEGEHEAGDGKAEGAWGGKGKGRKGKLLQRLKEKMHVGGSS